MAIFEDRGVVMRICSPVLKPGEATMEVILQVLKLGGQ